MKPAAASLLCLLALVQVTAVGVVKTGPAGKSSVNAEAPCAEDPPPGKDLKKRTMTKKPAPAKSEPATPGKKP